MNYKFTFFLCFIFSLHLSAQKYSNEFMTLGVGADAKAMGNANVAGVNDVTAGWWNPAALTQIDLEHGLQIGLMHSEWFGGVGKYDYLAVAGKIGDSERRFGVSLVRFAIDDIPNTLNLYDAEGRINYDNIVNFSAADYGLLFSYAQPIKFKNLPLSFGGNLKIIHRNIGSFAQAWGFGLDAALHYKKGNWLLGLVAKDITTTFNAWQFSLTEEEKQILLLNQNELPENELELTKPQLIFGLSYGKQFKKTGIRAELNLEITTDGKRNTIVSGNPFSMNPLLGIEGNFKKFIFLRLGANNLQKNTDLKKDPFWTVQPNVGVGLKIKNLQLDYAYTDIGGLEQGSYSHIISVVYDLNIKRK